MRVDFISKQMEVKSKKGEEIVTPDTQEAKKHFGKIFGAKKWNIIGMKLGKEELRKI